jgi:hypothetical protein
MTTLTVFFFGLALCMWRAPQADRLHVVLCLCAAALWCGPLLFDPVARNPPFGIAVITSLTIGLAKYLQRRAVSRVP